MLNAIRKIGLRQQIAIGFFLHAIILGGLLWLVLSAGSDSEARVYRFAEPAEIGAMAQALEQVPQENRRNLMNAFANASQRVALLSEFPSASAAANMNDRDIAELERANSAFAKQSGGRDTRLTATGTLRSTPANALFSPEPMRAYMQLRTGETLMVERQILPQAATVLRNFRWFVILLVLTDVALVFWLAGLTRLPARKLLRAVQEDRVEDLSISGPRELTELGAAFRELRAKLHRLLEERTRIIAAIAHDYRTYLTRLELRSDYIANFHQRELASADIAEMNALLDDTLIFAEQIAAGDEEIAEADIAAALTQMDTDRRMLGEAVSLSLGASDLTARIPQIAFRRIIANLVDNAVRHGDAVWVRATTCDHMIVVTVEDDGPGVPEDRLGDLTEPFMRLDESRARHTGGAGLGLSIVQALAQRHNVILALENREEGGFRARLWLPAA